MKLVKITFLVTFLTFLQLDKMFFGCIKKICRLPKLCFCLHFKLFLQLAKMMFLATFFPASTNEDDELHLGDKELPFDFVTVSFLSFFFFVLFENFYIKILV